MNEYEILKSPLVTERANLLREKYNQYLFRVDPKATKEEIKRAVKKFFNVEVKKVRTANLLGKFRRLAAGRPQGKRADWKKAIVTLKKGQEINIQEKVT